MRRVRKAASESRTMRAILYLAEETPRFIAYPDTATGKEALVATYFWDLKR